MLYKIDILIFQQYPSPAQKTIMKMCSKKKHREWLNNNIQPTKKQYGQRIQEVVETVQHRLTLLVGCCSSTTSLKIASYITTL
jgi:3-deoxy-D-arabino-heptulosonate 7-phosphate (DAHP) synthase